jgi:putative ABC transport system permease protein
MSMASAVRHELLALDKDQPVMDIKTVEQFISESSFRRRFDTVLLGIFAALALLMSGVGIFGVISYSISQGKHEIGVRMALGAKPRDVLRLVVRQGMILTLIGVLAGLAGAVAVTRVLSSLLYGVRPTDPLTYAGVSLLLASVAFLASYVPARRATKVDPFVALRCE